MKETGRTEKALAKASIRQHREMSTKDNFETTRQMEKAFSLALQEGMKEPGGMINNMVRQLRSGEVDTNTKDRIRREKKMVTADTFGPARRSTRGTGRTTSLRDLVGQSGPMGDGTKANG